MGAYLSTPLTDKESADEINSLLSCGSSQMQGWRMTQEDAHICSLDFDTDASLFAVFDGHGGSEVALYCAQKLPNFLKQLESYKSGDFEKALKDAFIGFDATLVNEDVIEEMKKLIPEKDHFSSESDEEADEEDISELCKEGRMPLNELLKKLRSGGALGNLTSEEGSSGGDAESSQSSSRKRNRKSQPSNSDNGECSSDAQKPNSVADEFGVTSTCSTAESSSSETKEKEPEKEKEKEKEKEQPSQGENAECGSTVDEDVPASSKQKSNANEANCSGSSVSSSSTSKHVAGGSGTNDSDTDDTDDSDEDEDMDSDSDGSTDGKNNAENEEDDLDYTEDGDDEVEDEESEDEYPAELEEDEKFLSSMFEGPGSSSGCTAVVALLKGNDLYVANAGDSRCVVCRDGKAMDMSFDHKPEDKEEFDRIHKAGGHVTKDGRVNGGLNLSRAIGDHGYKTNKELKPEEQMISALPDIKHAKIGAKDEFMILACDGIWNSFSSDDVVAFVRGRIEKGEKKMSAICEELFTKCLAPNTCGDGTGCDNMTAVIIQFQNEFKERFPGTEQPIEEQNATKKRPISPTIDIEAADSDTTKRFKTDGNHEGEEINAEINAEVK